MMTETLTPLEQFVREKTDLNLKLVDIQALIRSANFKPISISRIVQIQQKLGLKPKSSKRGRPFRIKA